MQLPRVMYRGEAALVVTTAAIATAAFAKNCSTTFQKNQNIYLLERVIQIISNATYVIV